MTTLTLKSVPEATVQTAVVDTPEFGDGMTVNVHGMTVATNNFLTKLSSNFSQTEDGTPTLTTSGRDQASIIAAMHSFDDDGNLTFGENFMDAIKRVEDLPMKYRAAILRISFKATELGRGTAGVESVDGAEKN